MTRLLLIGPVSDSLPVARAGISPCGRLEISRVDAGARLGRALRERRPGILLVSGECGVRGLWRAWFWRRWISPGAPLGVVMSGASRVARLLCDFFVVEAEAAASALRAGGVHRDRILISGARQEAVDGQVDEMSRWADFLNDRRVAARDRVVWIDPCVGERSPSTKHLVGSLPTLRRAGWAIEVWSVSIDDPDGSVDWRPMGRSRFPFWLADLSFLARAQWRAMADRVVRGPSARILHATHSCLARPDIASVHFTHAAWMRQRWRRLGVNPGTIARALLIDLVPMLLDLLFLRLGARRMFLPVSDAAAREVRRAVSRATRVRVLPNSYDESRFSPGRRAELRGVARAEFGLGSGQVAFVFASQGHHDRKGFWLAIEALRLLRARSDARAAEVRFLVVGGHERTLKRVRARLDRVAPGWRDWVILAGMREDTERCYAAGDAFLFPSYFEAFSLVEIEAAAMGLPLLLTPHPGTEMILEHGRNGLLLGWEPAAVAGQLDDLLSGISALGRVTGRDPLALENFAPSVGRALTREGYARELLEIYREAAGLREDAIPGVRG